jgi:hypothetical protein
MLWRGGAFGSGFFAVALVEAIDASCGIDQLLFTGKERVTGRTNFDVQVALLGRTSLKRLATSAANGYLDVFWVYSWFHFNFSSLNRRRHRRVYKRDMIGRCAWIVKLVQDLVVPWFWISLVQRRIELGALPRIYEIHQ